MIMPKMGESIMEATVLNWLKNEGDVVSADESILEVATDKIDTEVPASQNGILKKILVQKGEIAVIGNPICILEIAEGAENDIEIPKSKIAVSEPKIRTISTLPQTVKSTQILQNQEFNKKNFISPLVKTMAIQEGIGSEELEVIFGTGLDQRITKRDIESYLASGRKPQVIQVAKLVKGYPVNIEAEDEIIPMDRMRSMIAQRMNESQVISAHVTSFVDCDMTDIVHWRAEIKNDFFNTYNEPITFTPILFLAVAKALVHYPMMNIQVDGTNIVKKGNINIGMAVALQNGNLIVPVIHNANKLDLVGMTQAINDLTRRARENKLKPADLEGGTYTISNIGSFGNIMGTPILVQPQVGILAFGAIQKLPTVISTAEGDSIGIRHRMFISHSYDHRVVDGALGGMFVKKVADYLESFTNWVQY